jgi:predicted nucleic acid-binding protein
MQVTVELPDEIAKQIQRNSGDIGRSMLEALALDGYRTGNLTGLQIRQLLDLKSRFELDAFLKHAGDAGELEAIALAQRFTDSLLIIDEKEGRIEAARRGIQITGLLGVIRVPEYRATWIFNWQSTT